MAAARVTDRQSDRTAGDPARGAPARALTPAAERALKEAEARRAATEPATAEPEHGGRDGPDPTRYGDWEKKGIAVDF